MVVNNLLVIEITVSITGKNSNPFVFGMMKIGQHDRRRKQKEATSSRQLTAEVSIRCWLHGIFLGVKLPLWRQDPDPSLWWGSSTNLTHNYSAKRRTYAIFDNCSIMNVALHYLHLQSSTHAKYNLGWLSLRLMHIVASSWKTRNFLCISMATFRLDARRYPM